MKKLRMPAPLPRLAVPVFALALSLVLAGNAAAQSVDENALFGDDSSTTNSSGSSGTQGNGGTGATTGTNTANPDDMFQGDNVQNQQGSGQYKDEFLTDQAIKIGGNFDFSLGSRAYWSDLFRFDGDWIHDNTQEAFSLNVAGSLFFSARPAQDIRFFGKFKTSEPFTVNYSALSGASLTVVDSPLTIGVPVDAVLLNTTSTTIPVPQISIYELYSDFAVNDNVVVRVGKQAAKWGVGYFWSPADIISLTPVDLDNPTAEREGPIAIKTNVTFGLNSLDFYVIGNQNVKSVKDLGFASRAVLYLGDFEWGIGAGYQRDRSLQLVSTIAGSIGQINVFGEVKVSNGSLRRILKQNASNSNLIDVISYAPVDGWADNWFFAGTAGGSWSKSDPDIGSFNILVQYYFNSEGYQDSSILGVQDIGTKVYTLIGQQKISAGDLLELGRHYTALNMSFSPGTKKDFTFSTMWIGNWNDFSGTINPGISIKIVDHIQFNIVSSFVYGGENTEFVGTLFDAPVLDANGVPTGQTKSTRLNFKNPYERMSIGFTLSIGGGSF